MRVADNFKRCPFCGKFPTIDWYLKPGVDKLSCVFRIRCFDCNVEMSKEIEFSGYENLQFDVVDEEGIELANEVSGKWNMRADEMGLPQN